MSANFTIEARNNNGDLYLELSGDFDGNSAWELINKIKADYTEKGRIHINTDKVGEVNSFGKDVLEKLMDHEMISNSKFVFQGAKSVEIDPAGIKKENYKNKNNGQWNVNCASSTCLK
ncbi:MAG: hypothetical protein SWH54_01900 [Thermodesulfobacteriota bacterium]|nr:hypothetical protein [Thermodesulfobacteriota bacterium]